MSEAQRLRIDQLAAAVDRCLAAAEIPHALIKGATTSSWLYPPSRFYFDVDMLVPTSRVPDAIRALAADGIAYGEMAGAATEAGHSVELRTPTRYEVDLHSSLPSLPPVGDALWGAIAPHVVAYDLGVGVVDALDEVGRCLVLAFHALSGGERLDQRTEDLRRAVAAAPASTWTQARAIAATIGADDLFDAALTRVGGTTPPGGFSVRAALLLDDAPPEAMALDRFLRAPRRDWPAMILREFWPTSAFMRTAYPRAVERRGGILRARLARWGLIIARLPAALRAYRGARP